MDAVVIDTTEPQQNDEDAMEVCRVCLVGNHIMRDLFVESDVISLSTKAMSFASVKILPGDGLPPHVCCDCADKLEAAYEFKLQVEQADSLLREKYDNFNIKEELIFNEVEVRPEDERHEEVTESHHVDAHYEIATDNLNSDITAVKPTLLKDHLALLEVQKLSHQNDFAIQHNHIVQNPNHIETEEQYIVQQDNQSTCQIMNENINSTNDENHDKSEVIHEESEGITIEEHNYMVQQGYSLSSEQEHELINQQVDDHDTTEYLTIIGEDERSVKETEGHLNNMDSEMTEVYVQEKCENNTQSIGENKHKIIQNDGSNEENYFGNLNLSSRLSHGQENKEDKVFFMCYLCDRQFISKDILKEHMHSHEEVRQALSLKKTPEKSVKNLSPIKGQPPSGKKANKCPYCGKEYLYVISFKKHIKQHQNMMQLPNENELKDFVDSILQDDNSFDSNNFDNNDTFEIIPHEKSDSENQNSHNMKEMQDHDSSHKSNQIEIYFDGTGDQVVCKNEEKLLIKHLCNICNQEFDDFEKLKDHRTAHILEGTASEEDFKDGLENICNKEFRADKKPTVNKDSKPSMEIKKESTDFKCPNCNLLFGSKRSLTKHLETHEAVRYRCKICGDEFTHKEYLRKHAEQHTRVKSFKCTECSIIFANELTLRNHLIATNHKTTIKGEEYDPNKRIKRVAAKAAQKIIDKISTEVGLEDSEKDDDNDEFMVKIESVGTKAGEKSPAKKVTNKKNLECETCGKKCISKQALAKHMDCHVKNEKPEKADKLQNKMDPKESSKNIFGDDRDDDDDDDDDDFDGGLDWPMDNHECSTCKKRYSTKKSLLRHQLLHEEPNFECDICNVKFYRKDKLKAHYDKCSEKNPNQVRKCNICGDTFENNEILREHRSKHVDEGILTEEDLRELEPGSEDRKPGEKVPRKRRTDIVGLECTECNKQYTSRKGLLRHIQVHEGKKYLCDICPKKFYRREHLKIHVAKHNMVKPYKCSRCSKRFIKEEQLAAHVTKHERNFKKNKDSDSTAKRFLCEICSKSFTQSTTLVAHLRAHNGIKPYVCEVCARPFTTNAYLKMHMRTHTQERPYSCQYCSRAFARADTLANHLTSHTGEAKYHCKYCPKHFRRLKSLKEHVFIHTGQRPYACPTCDRRFNNNGSRYAHSKRCKQNMLQNQARQNQIQTQTQAVAPSPSPVQPTIRLAQPVGPTMQVVQSKNIKTITITRQQDQVGTHQIMQHQEILMPLILPLTVTLTDVDDEVILPEGTKIFTTT
ncbi:zinc finger protein 62 homolog [Chelonus insularis]|uniref:zinc finger protein 62 homolog n=1 Tax=Chelonus insularis TaxID=460826 RepID=UPI00158E18EE|nr:zinc finger protein 62 homolog [Chelonus insularis]